MKQRDLLLSGISLLLAFALSAAGFATQAQAQQPAPTPPTGQRPNIVFILVDNVGWGTFGAYGGTIPTPRIDKMASEGAETFHLDVGVASVDGIAQRRRMLGRA